MCFTSHQKKAKKFVAEEVLRPTFLLCIYFIKTEFNALSEGVHNFYHFFFLHKCWTCIGRGIIKVKYCQESYSVSTWTFSANYRFVYVLNSSVWNYLYPGYEPSPERIQEGQLEIILTCFWAWSVVLLPLLCSPLNNKKVYWNPLCTSVSRSYLECLDNEQFGLEARALRSFFDRLAAVVILVS